MWSSPRFSRLSTITQSEANVCLPYQTNISLSPVNIFILQTVNTCVMLIVNSKNTKFETILLFYSNLPPQRWAHGAENNDGRTFFWGANFFPRTPNYIMLIIYTCARIVIQGCIHVCPRTTGAHTHRRSTYMYDHVSQGHMVYEGVCVHPQNYATSTWAYMCAPLCYVGLCTCTVVGCRTCMRPFGRWSYEHAPRCYVVVCVCAPVIGGGACMRSYGIWSNVYDPCGRWA